MVVVNLACSVVVLTVPLPSVTVPSLNVTVPPGTPPKDGATVAVNVTDCPFLDGFSEDTIFVVVFAFFTVCVSPEVLVRKLALPP